jgi:hypothetical protein
MACIPPRTWIVCLCGMPAGVVGLSGDSSFADPMSAWQAPHVSMPGEVEAPQ